MKLTSLFCLLLLACPGLDVAQGRAAGVSASRAYYVRELSPATSAPQVFNLRDFGALGDGVTDDGPALQNALDALGQSGGGTLFVPAGRYAISTPVQKDFTGLASSVTILGVASLTPVPPPTATGDVLSRGLDLVSEFLPRTGEQESALTIAGLQTFLISDIAFVGTPEVITDAFITLNLYEIEDATVRHCEFYGLSTLVGPGIVVSVLSRLTVELCAFLGSTASSGIYASIVENIQWKGIAVTDTVFVDYGQRPGFFGKMGLSAPYSWVNLGNAAALTNTSPRREAVISNVFLDEGGFVGLSSFPSRYDPPSAPIDLLYVTGLFMNVSNLGTTGHHLDDVQRVLIEKSHYGWSHNTDSAINLVSVGNAILDQVECVDSANRIRADATTAKLTVIDSVYTFLDSQAPQTKVITTETPEEDPVQYVRQEFNATLGRVPDPAAHFYWSNLLLQCGEDAQCIAGQREALTAYLSTAPVPSFSISGTVTDESGVPVSGVVITLGGSQSVTAQTGADGTYSFAKLPTSGVYTVTPSHINYTFDDPPQTITTPNGDRAVDFDATIKRYSITVRINDVHGSALPGVAVSLSGPHEDQGVTDSTGAVTISGVPAGANYTIAPAKQDYSFSPASVETGPLQSDQTVTFLAGPGSYTISGRVVTNGNGLAGATVALSGSHSGTMTTDASGNYSFNVLAEGNYTLTPTKTNYVFSPASMTFNELSGNQQVDFTAPSSAFEFSTSSYSVAESTRTITVTVERLGDTAGEAEVTYLASDGTAEQRSDVIPVIGRLTFEPGETSKSFIIFVTDDTHVEGDESLTLEMNHMVGANLGNNSTATLTIVDNDSSQTAANPIDGARFFVRQHYRDFLNRLADSEGLDFWSAQISSCGTDATCLADRSMNVSAAFFLSIEFQQTGFLVYRLYQASYAQPPSHLDEFLLDTRTIGEGLVVNAPGWQDLLEANKTVLIEDFVGRPQFSEAYPNDLTPALFVNRLNTTAGGALSANDIAAATAEFAGAATSENPGARARVLRRVAESEDFSRRQTNPAFVMMQYFGYLQRNPNESPDNNLDGYNFWLLKLDEFGGDFRRAEMVKSFLVSGEYRARFGNP